MSRSQDVEDYVLTQVCPVLGLRPVPPPPGSKPGTIKRWRGDCFLCEGVRAFRLSIENGVLLWHCHGDCTQAALQEALATRFPGCFKLSARQEGAARDSEMRALLLDPDVPAGALRLGLLMSLDGLSALDARKKLEMGRSTYYDSVRILGQRRRSA